ncbi:la-related protein 6C [Silene latifolia]|uniref:la-related protein 6C n=1 Tax=Silene latifolia TaxID=37657 RepID=UPI003D76D079
MGDKNGGEEIRRSKSGGLQLNADAPEFIPTSHRLLSQNSMYFYYDGVSTNPPDWFYGTDQYPHHLSPPSSPSPSSPSSSSPLLSAHSFPPNFHIVQLKIVKQVEYLFSDLSLLANDTMAKHVSKDPQGYVPISVIASMKKIKVMVTDHSLLVQALRSSTKLVVSKDNKKVKRRRPFTEIYKEELQGRTVIVENLPEDHSYQNLQKIFSVVGSVKAIRLCHPPEQSPCRSKTEVIISNKVHALVEYENPDIAERAAEALNDQRDWRKGMRVRVLLRRTPKSVLKGRKSDFDILTDEEEECPEEASQPNVAEFFSDKTGDEDSGGSRKMSIRVGEKLKKSHSGRGILVSPTTTKMPGSPFHLQCNVSPKLINKAPRMPDGSKGFTMGRGKPLTTSPISSHATHYSFLPTEGTHLIKVQFLKERAACANKLHEYEAAINFCSLVLSSFPKNAKALFRRAIACMKTNMLLEAQTDLETASMLEPKNKDILRELNVVKNVRAINHNSKRSFDEQLLCEVARESKRPIPDVDNIGDTSVNDKDGSSCGSCVTPFSDSIVKDICNFENVLPVNLEENASPNMELEHNHNDAKMDENEHIPNNLVLEFSRKNGGNSRLRISEQAYQKILQGSTRKGMRVRVMLRRTPKSVLKGRKSDFDILTDEEEECPEEASQPNVAEFFSDKTGDEDSGGSRKMSIRVGEKLKKSHSGRGILVSPTATKMPGSPFHLQCNVSPKLINKAPRMPDGSKGFTMGRGKPLTTSPISSHATH